MVSNDRVRSASWASRARMTGMARERSATSTKEAREPIGRSIWGNASR